MEFNNLKITGALLKIGHLAMFSALGYQWLLHDYGGIEISRVLREQFVMKPSKEDRLHFLKRYMKCMTITMRNDLGRVRNSIEDNYFIVHSLKPARNAWFAVSVLIPINDFVFNITLPSCDKKHGSLRRRLLYDKFINGDRSIANSFPMIYADTHWKAARDPLVLKNAGAEKARQLINDYEEKKREGGKEGKRGKEQGTEG